LCRLRPGLELKHAHRFDIDIQVHVGQILLQTLVPLQR